MPKFQSREEYEKWKAEREVKKQGAKKEKRGKRIRSFLNRAKEKAPKLNSTKSKKVFVGIIVFAFVIFVLFELNEIREDIRSIERAISDLEYTLTFSDIDDIAELRSDIYSLESRIDDLESDKYRLKSHIDDLESDINHLESDLNTIDNAIESAGVRGLNHRH